MTDYPSNTVGETEQLMEATEGSLRVSAKHDKSDFWVNLSFHTVNKNLHSNSTSHTMGEQKCLGLSVKSGVQSVVICTFGGGHVYVLTM